MSELKIVSYNIEHSLQVELILKNLTDLANQGVSVFCLQEVRKSSAAFIGDLILEKLGSNWQAEYFLSDNHNSDHGLAIIWNSNSLTKNKMQKVSLNKLEKLDLHEQAIELAQGSNYGPIQRGAMVGNFTWNDQSIRITNLHIDWHGWANHHARQFEELLNYLKSESEVSAEVIGGDFNTLGFFGIGRRLRRIENLLGEKFINVFPKYHTTTTNFQQLDQIFVRNFKISQAQVLYVPGSDHYPIMVTLS